MVFPINFGSPLTVRQQPAPPPDPAVAQIAQVVIAGEPAPSFGGWRGEKNGARARRLWLLQEAGGFATRVATALASGDLGEYELQLDHAATFPQSEAELLEVLARVIEGKRRGWLPADIYDWLAEAAPRVGGDELMSLVAGISRDKPQAEVSAST